MDVHNVRIRKLYGTSTLKELEREKVIELRRKALVKRVREINAAAREPPAGHGDRRSSWGTLGFRTQRGSSRLGSDAA